MPVNNFEIIRKLLHFELDGDVYFAEVIARGKDKGKSGEHLIRDFHIHGMDQFDKLMPEIIDLCDHFSARCYLRLNQRNMDELNSYLKIKLEEQEKELSEKVTKIMMVIPNIIDPSVPIGKDDSENVEVTKYGEPVVPDFEVPYHTDIMERFNGIDIDAAGRVAGNGFYYLMGDIARLHSAILSYGRDFMIDRGFTYCIPPFMIRSKNRQSALTFRHCITTPFRSQPHRMVSMSKCQIPNHMHRTLIEYPPC